MDKKKETTVILGLCRVIRVHGSQMESLKVKMGTYEPLLLISIKTSTPRNIKYSRWGILQYIRDMGGNGQVAILGGRGLRCTCINPHAYICRCMLVLLLPLFPCLCVGQINNFQSVLIPNQKPPKP